MTDTPKQPATEAGRLLLRDLTSWDSTKRTYGERILAIEAEAAAGTFIYLDSLGDVRAAIRECEGQHVQQVSYSTYHDALTQVCFTEGVVRTSMAKP